MTVGKLLDAFDNWNSFTLVINDDRLKTIEEGKIHDLVFKYYNEKVVSFGVYGKEFCIRINKTVDVDVE